MKRGFTLIELLVVIFIIGLLASIVVISVNSARKKARDARRIADLDTVRTALELYADANNGLYPCQGAIQYTDGSLNLKWNRSDRIGTGSGTDLDWVGTGGTPLEDFLPVLPVDPINRDLSGKTQTYAYASLDGNEYKIIVYNMESTEGQARAANDGGVWNGGTGSAWHYELFSPGGQGYQNDLNGITPCLITGPSS